jgi:hypothetical protein
MVISDEEKRTTAWHEAGHALVAHARPEPRPGPQGHDHPARPGPRRDNERSERDGSVRSSAPSSPSAGQALAGPAGVEASRVEPSHLEIWGVLNVTPDSFSDGGAHYDRDAAYAHAQRMRAEGADVIDVGGASSRPRGATYGEGAATIDAAEEIRRTVPVIEALRARGITAKLSIDTTRAEVAEAALRAGASIVNDVSMGREPALLEVSAARTAPSSC